MQCYKCATPIPDNSRFCSTCGADVSGAPHGHEPTMVADHDPDLFLKLQADLGTEYILEKELGRGGMAVVYLGHDAHLHRKVAVKVLPPELTYGGSSMIERFKREAQTAAKLDHPNIIPVHRVSTGGKLFWYVMKYLDGEALDHILKRESQLTVERTVEIVSQVAAALDYAHQNQVIHRDVKPANVIIDKRGQCTVTDFGIAKALDADTLTASGSIIGTPYYMSPEQCTGKRVGPAADQYSLAVMTYQMLGGHVPFTGDSAVEIVHKHVADPVPPLGVLRAQLPETVVRVVERALCKKAEDRFASVADYAQALKAASQGLPVDLPARHAPSRTSATALVASPLPDSMKAVPAPTTPIPASTTPIPPPTTPIPAPTPTFATAPPQTGLRVGLLLTGLGSGLAVAAVALVLVLKPWQTQGGGAVRTDTVPLKPNSTVAQVVPPKPATDSAAADSDTVAGGAAVSWGYVVLRSVPAGASIQRDGRAWRGGSRIRVTPGRPHTITVTAEGYDRWSQDVTLRADQSRSFDVALTRAAGANVSGGQVTGGAAGQGAQGGRTTQQQGQGAGANTSGAGAVQPGAGGAQSAGTATIRVMTFPPSVLYANNGLIGPTPAINRPIPSGTVVLRFQVTDSTGQTWSVTRTETVQPGGTLNLGSLTLRRTP